MTLLLRKRNCDKEKKKKGSSIRHLKSTKIKQNETKTTYVESNETLTLSTSLIKTKVVEQEPKMISITANIYEYLL